MIIGQIGWSGQGNWGDDRMLACLKRYFPHDTILPFMMWKEDIEKIHACDYILIGGGGLISRGFSYYLEFLRSVRKPFGCIGVSIEANAVNADMKAGIEFLKKHAEFIYVRDKKSAILFGNHYKVFVGPDVSFLYPFAPVKILGDHVGVNLRDWPWWDLESFSKGDYLCKTIDAHLPAFKQLYPFKKWEPEKLMRIIRRSFDNVLPLPFYFKQEGMSDRQYLQTFFRRVPTAPSIHMFDGVRLVIGMRLHALIFSTQLGIPFISLSYEPKNEQFCRELGFPELSLPLKAYPTLMKKVTYVHKHHDDIRARLIDYRASAQKEARYLFSTIEKLIHTKQ